MDQYKSARAEAEHTAALLRAAMQRAGLPEHEAARVRVLVTGKGRAYVEIGATAFVRGRHTTRPAHAVPDP